MGPHGGIVRRAMFRATPRMLSQQSSFYGPVQKQLEATLNTAFSPLHIEVTNESHGPPENESHFHVLLVSSDFEGKRPVAQHRLVNSVLTEGRQELPFHSLRLTTRTPEQWANSKTAPGAPKCSGGDGLRGARQQ